MTVPLLFPPAYDFFPCEVFDCLACNTDSDIYFDIYQLMLATCESAISDLVAIPFKNGAW